MGCLFIPTRGFLVTANLFSIHCNGAGLVVDVTVSDVDANIVKTLTMFNIYKKEVIVRVSELLHHIKIYSHQLMHFFIQLCISLLSYIKIT